MPSTTSAAEKYLGKLPQDWQDAETIIGAGAYRVLLYGPPGTGKTYCGRHSGVKAGQKVWNVYVSEESPAYDVIGHDVVAEGSMVWRDGPAIAAWRNGGRLVINEIDSASGDTLDALVAICDDPESAGYTLPTGEYVEPQPGFQVVATMNGDPRDLPDKLQSRFSVRVPILHPHPAALAKLPEAIRDTAKLLTGPRVEESRRLNVRQFNAYAELTRLGVADDLAARVTFHDQASEMLDAFAVKAATA